MAAEKLNDAQITAALGGGRVDKVPARIAVVAQPRAWPWTATADDENDNLAMLLRREGETLAELLTRLDLAIAKARTLPA